MSEAADGSMMNPARCGCRPEATLSLPVREVERREPRRWSSMVDCDDLKAVE